MDERIYAEIEFMEVFRFSEDLKGNALIGQVKRMPFHMHDGIELLYILRGEAEIRISFNDYILKSGDFMLVNSFEVHRIKTDETAEILFVQLDKTLFKGKEFAFDPYFYENFNKDAVREVKELMAEAYLSFGNEAKKQTTDEIFERIASLCDRFFQMHLFDIFNRDQAAFNDNQTNRQRICDIYEYMYEAFHKKIKLSDVAGLKHIDMFYTSRLIKDGMGTSFQNTLNIIRTDRAELFLLGTDLPVQQVGEKVGFSSHSYFVKHFREFFGMTPSAYRLKYRNQIYPRQQMEYRRVFYERLTLMRLMRVLETGRQEKTEEQCMEDLQEGVEYVKKLCSMISEDQRSNERLSFARKKDRIEIQLKDSGELFLIKVQN